MLSCMRAILCAEYFGCLCARQHKTDAICSQYMNLFTRCLFTQLQEIKKTNETHVEWKKRFTREYYAAGHYKMYLVVRKWYFVIDVDEASAQHAFELTSKRPSQTTRLSHSNLILYLSVRTPRRYAERQSDPDSKWHGTRDHIHIECSAVASAHRHRFGRYGLCPAECNIHRNVLVHRLRICEQNRWTVGHQSFQTGK